MTYEIIWNSFECLNSIIGAQPPSFMDVLPTAAFALFQPGSVVATETIWPIKLNIFSIWPFAGKVC